MKYTSSSRPFGIDDFMRYPGSFSKGRIYCRTVGTKHSLFIYKRLKSLMNGVVSRILEKESADSGKSISELKTEAIAKLDQSLPVNPSKSNLSFKDSLTDFIRNESSIIIKTGL